MNQRDAEDSVPYLTCDEKSITRISGDRFGLCNAGAVIPAIFSDVFIHESQRIQTPIAAFPVKIE